MPIIRESSYTRRPLLYFNSYLETLIPYFFTKVGLVPYQRERMELPDGDFLDLDWLKGGNRTLILVSHGFEGNAKDHFIENSAKFFHPKGYDILVWHYRSCSQEINRLPRFYDHGDIEDLQKVIETNSQDYDQVVLIGFSMGGTMVVNYLGSENVHEKIKGGLVFSAPFDLKASAENLERGFNRNLERSFLKKWKRKIQLKAEVFPDRFNLEGLEKVSGLGELYSRFLLQVHGYDDMEQYYQRWSSHQYIPKVNVPLLIVNALNDPLLSKNCYPVELCLESESVYLETPRFGGHNGFTRKHDGVYWYLTRIEEFLNDKIL